ncbi:MAG: DUF2778 domain-containing protein [Xanthobacteraceae bacterium]|jgi:hypothetical protein
MAFSTEWRDNFCEGYDQGRLSGNARPQRLLGGAALACVAFACAWSLWANLTGTGPDRVLDAQPRPATASNTDARLALASNAYAKLATALNSYARKAALSTSYARLFDSRYLGAPPEPFDRIAALPVDSQPAIEQTPDVAVTGSIDRQAVQRDAALAQPPRLPPRRTASLRETAPASRTAANPPAEKPSIFEKLFGKPAPLTLAYAAPDDGDLGGQSIIPGRYDRWTAVYDISARKVYLPDGTTLEAHSGYGNRLDDPHHVDERMRGATPPTVYDLKLRESLFHGVQALRLIPEDEDKVFGRSGLLAHTYMLGPNGDSNGCVSFRDYDAFLQAYLNRRIKRLAVVTRLD